MSTAATISWEDLDRTVQHILSDTAISPEDRAVEAVIHMERRVRAEFGLESDVPLVVPPEWAHKVPHVEPEPEPQGNVFMLASGGWSAPSDVALTLPDFSVERGGFSYDLDDEDLEPQPKRRWWKRWTRG